MLKVHRTSHGLTLFHSLNRRSPGPPGRLGAPAAVPPPGHREPQRGAALAEGLAAREVKQANTSGGGEEGGVLFTQGSLSSIQQNDKMGEGGGGRVVHPVSNLDLSQEEVRRPFTQRKRRTGRAMARIGVVPARDAGVRSDSQYHHC